VTPPSAAWLAERRDACDMQVAEIPFAESREWAERDGRIRHRTGGFFSITGVRVIDGRGTVRQAVPLIDQPEIGILGFVVRRRGGRAEVLVQAKPEPGNVGLVQLAPTVQATESNYRRRHGGKPTPLLEVFEPQGGLRTASTSLQSEQGSRFLGKYNRNVTVEAPTTWTGPDLPHVSWLGIADLQPLLLTDYAVNTDARSVLATTPFDLLADDDGPFARWRGEGGFGEALLDSYTHRATEAPGAAAPRAVRRLEALRAQLPFASVSVPLDALPGWHTDARSISRLGAPSYEVRQYAVTSSEREVPHWDQPLIAASEVGTATLLVQRRAGVLHLLVSAMAEAGLRECLQFGPSLQSVPGPGEIFPDLDDRHRTIADLAATATEVASSLHSDEGGRFHRCVSRYTVAEL
jgi:oxidase EvaA